MAAQKVNNPQNVIERNINLVNELMRYLLNKPKLFNSLPDDFELVILPDDDPEIRLYNLEMLDTCGDAEKAVVFARIKSSQKSNAKQMRPSLYIPVAV